MPEGSNNHVRPRRLLTLADHISTSVLVEVVTTAPGAVNRLGTTTDVVLPERGGPRTKSACCGPANSGLGGGLIVAPRKKPPQGGTAGTAGAELTTSALRLMGPYPLLSSARAHDHGARGR